MTDKPQRTHYLGCWHEHPECAQAAMIRVGEKLRRLVDVIDAEEMNAEQAANAIHRFCDQEGIA